MAIDVEVVCVARFAAKYQFVREVAIVQWIDGRVLGHLGLYQYSEVLFRVEDLDGIGTTSTDIITIGFVKLTSKNEAICLLI